jgi:hypothetical protein
MRWARRSVLLLVVVAACTGGGHDAETPRVHHEERPPVVDYTGTHLAHVPGTTTTTGPVETGTASIVGTVAGPGGPVPGATVRVDHLVRGRAITHDVLTGGDGRYSVPAIPGGRYRVRAFLAPALAVTKPEVRFLEDGKEATFDLTMDDQRKVVANAAIAPSVPYLHEAVNLSVVVAAQAVDLDGVVRSTPIPGLRVELDGLGAWSFRHDQGLRTPLQPRATTSTSTTLPTSTTGFTDGTGVVRYELQCDRVGDAGLGVLVSLTVTPPAVDGAPASEPEQRIDRLALEIPACVDPAAATQSTEGSPFFTSTSSTKP